MAFGTAKSVLFIEVSSFQGVLIRGVPLYTYILLTALSIPAKLKVCGYVVECSFQPVHVVPHTANTYHIHNLLYDNIHSSVQVVSFELACMY